MKGSVMKRTLKTVVAFALLTYSFSTFALSDTVSPVAPATPQITPTKPGLHFVLNGGLTYGGDTIYTAVFTNGDTSNIKGGSFVHLGWARFGKPKTDLWHCC